MTSTVLLPVVSHAPWARSVAETVIEVESPSDVDATLLYVFDEKERDATREEVDASDPTLETLAGTRSSVSATAETLRDAGFDVSIDGEVAAEESEVILETARTSGVDRLYIYNRNRSPVGKTVYGSTVTEVLSNATRPVVVIPAERF